MPHRWRPTRRRSCCSPTARELFDNTYERYLIKYFRDHLPFSEVPIKVYLRAKPRDGDARPADETVMQKKTVTRKSAKPMKSGSPDLSKLRFKSEVSEEELDRESKRATESELWRDL